MPAGLYFTKDGLTPYWKTAPIAGRMWIHFGLGEIDQGFDWLEKAVDERDGFVIHFHVDPCFEALRSHPRYQALLRKMNLEA